MRTQRDGASAPESDGLDQMSCSSSPNIEPAFIPLTLDQPGKRGIWMETKGTNAFMSATSRIKSDSLGFIALCLVSNDQIVNNADLVMDGGVFGDGGGTGETHD